MILRRVYIWYDTIMKKFCLWIAFIAVILCCTACVRTSGNAGSNSPITAESTPEAEPIETKDGVREGNIYCVFIDGQLDLHVAPSTSAPGIQKLENGTLVMALESDDEFMLVLTRDGHRGYVMSDYLILSAKTFESADDKPGTYTTVCDERLDVYAQSGGAGTSVAKLKYGTQVKVTDFEGQFAHIDYDGGSGYVQTKYLNKGDYEPFDSVEKSVRTAPSGMWIMHCEETPHMLRSVPGFGDVKIGEVNDGETLEVSAYDGLFAKVLYNNIEGYVNAGFLTQQGTQTYEEDLSIIKPSAEYSYDQMIKDINKLVQKYPDKLTLSSIGTSEQGRDLPVLILGDASAPHQVFIQASIHAREYMTSVLVLAQIEYSLARGENAFMQGTLSDALENVCFHIVPMANPDGVEICQSSTMSEQVRAIYERDVETGRTELSEQKYIMAWKANANGVDLNRNFDAKWDLKDDISEPSGNGYKGKAPEDQSETKALADYVRSHDFDATISYHAFGSLIYWEFGDNEQANERSRDLGRAVHAVTNYTLEPVEDLDSGGLKDWALGTLDIPSLTIEIGTQDCTLPIEEFSSIWLRNRSVLAAIGRWVKAIES